MRNFFSGIIGNIFKYYDNALFGLLAPFIAPLFFPSFSPISALILTYGMMILGIVSKPIGALAFGYIGDRFGRKKALFLSLLGMALITCFMGCIPIYSQIGIAAPILLALARFFQSFFSAGETSGGAILILEKTPEKLKSLFSSLYNGSAVLGILLASFVVTYFASHQEVAMNFWRIPFFLGGICGLWALILRLFAIEPLQKRERIPFKDHMMLLWRMRKILLPIMFAAGFSYCTYVFSFNLMNGFLPFVCDMTKEGACQINTWLLLFDLCMLPLFGWIATKYPKEKVMGICALLTILLALPLFLLLDGGSIATSIFVRFVIVTLGVGFSAPYEHWAQEKVPQEMRYTVVATATAIGSQLIGLPSAALSLWLYKKTGWVAAPGLYLMMAACFGGLALTPFFARAKISYQ